MGLGCRVHMGTVLGLFIYGLHKVYIRILYRVI